MVNLTESLAVNVERQSFCWDFKSQLLQNHHFKTSHFNRCHSARAWHDQLASFEKEEVWPTERGVVWPKKKDSYCKHVNHDTLELVNCSINVVVSELFKEWTAFCHSTKSKELHKKLSLSLYFWYGSPLGSDVHQVLNSWYYPALSLW